MARTRLTYTYLLDRARCDPDRTAAWRWDIARRVVHQQLGVCKEMDQDMADAVRLLTAERNARWGQLPPDPRVFPTVRAARAIYQESGRQRGEIEARTLAGEDPTQIASKMGLAPRIVAAYCSLFFNLGDGRATDWIRRRALGVHPGMRRLTDFDCWRWLGLAGGSGVIDLVIDHLDRRRCPDPAERALSVYLVYLLFYFWACWGADARNDRSVLNALLWPLSTRPLRLSLPRKTKQDRALAMAVLGLRAELTMRRRKEKAARSKRAPYPGFLGRSRVDPGVRVRNLLAAVELSRLARAADRQQPTPVAQPPAAGPPCPADAAFELDSAGVRLFVSDVLAERRRLGLPVPPPPQAAPGQPVVDGSAKAPPPAPATSASSPADPPAREAPARDRQREAAAPRPADNRQAQTAAAAGTDAGRPSGGVLSEIERIERNFRRDLDLWRNPFTPRRLRAMRREPDHSTLHRRNRARAQRTGAPKPPRPKSLRRRQLALV